MEQLSKILNDRNPCDANADHDQHKSPERRWGLVRLDKTLQVRLPSDNHELHISGLCANECPNVHSEDG